MSSTEAAAAENVDRFGLVGKTLENRFHVERMVAEGGFGVVYYGQHLALERPIAIKVLKTPQEFNDAARAAFHEKFAMEAKTIARVSHPNIVQVLDFGVSLMPSGEQAPWMVLEWLTGQTLEEELGARRGRGGRGAGEVMAIMRPVFEALAYAHDEGIAHRDIKPANMMIVRTKRGSTLRLLDFGIAKLMEEGEGAGTGQTRTRTAMNAFSPMYAAPEQIGQARTGPWTDVHALGLIMTEVLTDLPPYEGEDVTTLFGHILSKQRPTPAVRRVDAGAWEGVLQKALGLKPDDRYRNAGEFLAALDANVPAIVRPAGSGGDMALAAVNPSASISGLQNPSLTTLRGAAVTSQSAAPVAQPSRRVPILAISGFAIAGVLAAVAAVHFSRGPTAPQAAHVPTVATPPVVIPPVIAPAVVTPVAAPVAVAAPPVAAPPAVVPTPPAVVPAVAEAPVVAPTPTAPVAAVEPAPVAAPPVAVAAQEPAPEVVAVEPQAALRAPRVLRPRPRRPEGQELYRPQVPAQRPASLGGGGSRPSAIPLE